MRMHMFGLILRWSWRDLRRRWPVVAAIALVAAIGTGVFASLNSMADWRRSSNAASLAALHMHDLRVAFETGTVQEQRLRTALAAMPHASAVSAADVRLRLPAQVQSADGKDIRNGVVVGLSVAGGGPRVDTIHRTGGRPLTPADQGRPVAVLEYNYAEAAHLGTSGQVRVTGRNTVSYVGTGLAVDYLFNGFPISGFGVQSGLAVLFTPLDTAQSLAGAPGRVNDLVLTLRPGSDRAAVQRELTASLHKELPGTPFTVTSQEQDPTRKLLYDDADSDQQSFVALAVLILFGAALAAFNLTTRVIQAQRREIGVEMALGVGSRLIVARPLLFALQVAVLGAVAGIGVGLAMNQAMVALLNDVMPMPVWSTGFRGPVFAEAALIGLLLPFAGALIPVLGVVRTQPVDAIRTGPRVRRGNLLTALSARIRLPGRTLAHLPLREVLRAPLRPLLTAVGVGAAIAAIIGMFGSVDGMDRAFGTAGHELTRSAPGRVTITLDEFYPAGSGQVTGVTGSSLLTRAEPGLVIPATVVANGHDVDLGLSFLDLRSAMWTPTLERPIQGGAGQGLVLTEKAAKDLGVRPGDTVRLRHPARQGTSYREDETPLRVSALTPYPLRGTAYMDAAWARRLGLAGLVNVVQAQPAAGTALLDLRRELLPHGGVASVESVEATTRQFKEALSQFSGTLQILEGIALALVLLIAFNAASLNADERAREHATVFAFGYRPRVALATAMAESFIVGVLGTFVGIGLGYLALLWITRIRVREFPDLEITSALSFGTCAVAVTFGVLLVTIAPILTLRRLRRMDLPSTLRVVE